MGDEQEFPLSRAAAKGERIDICAKTNAMSVGYCPLNHAHGPGQSGGGFT